MLPNEYRDTFLDLLRVVSETHASITMKLTAFWPLRGGDYSPSSGLLLVGRAVNGGDRGWVPSKMSTETERVELIDGLIGEYDMSWVVKKAGSHAGYNANQSAFWRVAHRVHDTLQGASDEWSSQLCWTNLYKLAPCEGGNPPTWLKRTQCKHCIDLLRIEVLAWKPKVALVLAGSDWFEPFAKELNLDLRPSIDCKLVQQWGDSAGVRWVVGKHPQGKPEDQFVKEICQTCR